MFNLILAKMANSTLITNITPYELESRIEKVFLKALAAVPNVGKEQFLTRDQLAEKLHISKVTLDKNCREGLLTPVRLAGRVLFRESELELTRIEYKGKKRV